MCRICKESFPLAGFVMIGTPNISTAKKTVQIKIDDNFSPFGKIVVVTEFCVIHRVNKFEKSLCKFLFLEHLYSFIKSRIDKYW